MPYSFHHATPPGKKKSPDVPREDPLKAKHERIKDHKFLGHIIMDKKVTHRHPIQLAHTTLFTWICLLSSNYQQSVSPDTTMGGVQTKSHIELCLGTPIVKLGVATIVQRN